MTKLIRTFSESLEPFALILVAVAAMALGEVNAMPAPTGHVTISAVEA
jgi:hypothetical protein